MAVDDWREIRRALGSFLRVAESAVRRLDREARQAYGCAKRCGATLDGWHPGIRLCYELAIAHAIAVAWANDPKAAKTFDLGWEARYSREGQARADFTLRPRGGRREARVELKFWREQSGLAGVLDDVAKLQEAPTPTGIVHSLLLLTTDAPEHPQKRRRCAWRDSTGRASTKAVIDWFRRERADLSPGIDRLHVKVFDTRLAQRKPRYVGALLLIDIERLPLRGSATARLALMGHPSGQ